MSTQRIELTLKQAENGVFELRLEQTLAACFLVDVYELVELLEFKGGAKKGSKTRRTSSTFRSCLLLPLLVRELGDILYSVGLDEVLSA